MADEETSTCSEDLQQLTFIKRGGGTVLLHAGYQYILKEKYKNGTAAWECINRRKMKCCGKMTLKDNFIVGEKKHECQPDYTKNELDENIFKSKRQSPNFRTVYL